MYFKWSINNKMKRKNYISIAEERNRMKGTSLIFYSLDLKRFIYKAKP